MAGAHTSPITYCAPDHLFPSVVDADSRTNLRPIRFANAPAHPLHALAATDGPTNTPAQ